MKCRCRKWPYMNHSDICSTSYGWKKGQESNWQYDSWSLKVRILTYLLTYNLASLSGPNSANWPYPSVCRWSATHCWKSSWGKLQVCFRPHPNRRSELGVMNSQSPGNPNQDSFGTPPWESRDKKPFVCRCCGQTHRILYGGRWWPPSSPGRGESNESVLPMACPNTKSDSKCELTNLLVGFDAGSSN